ncbi:DNA-deoxyinosine glycosylase [Mangrovibacterium diazotrophicum]|uniref:G/U mismatch-specific uracil-DNA glycosylase n=1 Tax=Mangrovibacterium diazotrophicum TaxID=1261403 RepID=A0A419W3J6_9BACT|nr:DNA-deoxyinosine glycosylase [Mangrovibacterium diazotrophicum]RKD90048.1 G/U mismatch-specific uracil-DNA glycosylase [Mangrovibacterium diazotrophicum]
MGTIIRNRTIRPSSRLESSKNYKIDTKVVGAIDTLRVNIDHESDSFLKSYWFHGKDVAYRNSISFRVTDYGPRIDISWSGAQPYKEEQNTRQKQSVDKLLVDLDAINRKMKVPTEGIVYSLDPVVDDKSKILILGTMPGEESLRQQAYYAHPRNLFWKLIEAVIGESLPGDYEEKKSFLLHHGIALWDVCHSCERQGSLDTDISDELPNDIANFIVNYPNVTTIGLNGKKAAQLFGKYIGSIQGIKLFALPSSSPANASIPWEEKRDSWLRLKQYL